MAVAGNVFLDFSSENCAPIDLFLGCSVSSGLGENVCFGLGWQKLLTFPGGQGSTEGFVKTKIATHAHCAEEEFCGTKKKSTKVNKHQTKTSLKKLPAHTFAAATQ